MTDIPNTYRFFVSPDAINGDTVLLTDRDVVHQMGRVLRLRRGALVLLLDGLGNAYTTRLVEIGRERVTGAVEERQAANNEPAVALSLYLPLLRAERFEWVLQKATELGVGAFVPIVSSHSLPMEWANEHKLARWQRIAREAAEQSCRTCIPRIEQPHSFPDACAQAAAANLALILWEGSSSQQTATPSLRAVLRQHAPRPAHSATVAVFSGPEGGIDPAELTIAMGHGIIPVSLGPRILRAETAPIAAVAAIFYELEE